MQGCTYVAQSFVEYIVNHGKVILLLVEAIGAYWLICYWYFIFIVLDVSKSPKDPFIAIPIDFLIGF